MTTQKCRAKNPATCRVHGSTNPITALMNHNVALANLRSSTKAAELATNLEELSEAKQLVFFDQKVYDATLAGKNELQNKIKGWGGSPRPTLSEELEYRSRKAEGEKYREEVIESTVSFKESKTIFNKITEANSVASHIITDRESAKNAIDDLADTPYGTPIAIKTRGGAYIYGGAGDGLLPDAKRTGFFNKLVQNKLLQRKFIQRWPESAPSDGFISLQNSGTNFDVRNVKEIHILKADTFKHGMDIVKNHHASATDDTNTNSRYAIEGDDYYYELEGSRLKDWGWQEGGIAGNGISLLPHNVKSITEIKPS